MKNARTLLVLFGALALASAGVDVSRTVLPHHGMTGRDVLILFVLAAASAVPLLFLAGAIVRGRETRAGGLMIAAAIWLHVAMGLRFGPMLNLPLRDPLVLGVVGGSAILLGAVGFACGPLVWKHAARLQWVGLVGPIGLAVAFIRGVEGAPDGDGTGPNVVVITLDTTRMDRLGAYGHGAAQTPHLDELARTGVVFDQAIAAAPQTGPSHLSILTGRYPLSHGVFANGTPIGDHPESLARVLQDAGYNTGGFVSAFPVHARFGFDQGFDVFDSDFSPLPGMHDLAPVRLLDLVVFRNVPRERRGDRTNGRALRWLEQVPEPFMLWVHYYDPHGPYTAPADVEQAFVTGEPARDGKPLSLPEYWPSDQRTITDPARLAMQYDAEIAWTDGLVGELLGAVEKRKLENEVVVVATADHGEALGEHEIWFDHGDDLYDPALRIPLIVAGPMVSKGTRVPTQVSSVDILPTLLDLVGKADGIKRDGTSRVPELRGETGADAPAYASTVAARRENPPVHHAARTVRNKCIQTESDQLFFVLDVDPGEVRDAEPIAEGEALCRALAQRVADGAKPVEAAGGSDVQEALEILGYIEGSEP